MPNSRVLVISHDVVGTHMAGPGIRYRELSRVLSQHFPVTLAVPNEADLPTPFAVRQYERGRWDSLAPAAYMADVIVACGDTLAEFPALAELPIPLVVDGYDPHTLEALAMWAGEPRQVQAARYGERLQILRRQCQAADLLICASERQRDWWLGLLEQEGRINPLTYADDPSLRRLVDVVPYGLPTELPQTARPVLRGVWPGLGRDDAIVLWGGGLWEWLDPLTALRAVRRLADEGRAVRLLFPGTRHPNPVVPDMPMRARTLALADELELTGRYAFFGDWVPHDQWPAVLLEADVGLSLHPDTVEARLAYRSRVLDYIWAGLPMVVTLGDATADLISGYGLGLTVGYGDDAAVAQAVGQLLDERGTTTGDARRDQFAAARHELTWARAAEPLVAFCRAPRRAPDRARRWIPDRAPHTVPTDSSASTDHSADLRRGTGAGGPPAASVIVLTWNGVAYIEDCLQALLAQQFAGLEVLVVDNGSVDGTPDLVAQRFPEVRLFRNRHNLGFAAGNNVGLRAAQGDILVLLNQDTQVHPGWLAALARTFDDPSVGIAGCKLLYPDGTIQHAGGFVYGPRGQSDHVGRTTPDDGRYDQLADVDYATGAALAIGRSVLNQVGLLDEGFAPAYYEDTDWCYRVRAAGYRVMCQPRAVVTHFESTASDPASYERKRAVHQGRLRFLFKHWPLDRLLYEFGPAESAWLLTTERNEELMATRRAYLHTRLTLPELLAYRGSTAVEADALVGLLSDLQAAVAAGLALQSPPQEMKGGVQSMETAEGRERARLLEALQQDQALREHVFRSYVPLLGPIIAAVRNLWNSVATKWYVRPVLHQQSMFNAHLTAYLLHLERRIQGQSHDVAETIRELTMLAERLTDLYQMPSHPAVSTSGQDTEDPEPCASS